METKKFNLEDLTDEDYQIVKDIHSALFEKKAWNPFTGKYEVNESNETWGLTMLTHNLYLKGYLIFQQKESKNLEETKKKLVDYITNLDESQLRDHCGRPIDRNYLISKIMEE